MVIDIIARRTRVIVVTPYNVTYDAAAHTATGTATGVSGERLGGLNLSGTTHTAAGTTSDPWTFTDVTGNYNNASGTVTTTSQGERDHRGDGLRRDLRRGGAHGDGHGDRRERRATGRPRPRAARRTRRAGTTSDPWTFTDVTGNYNNASGTVDRQYRKATATIAVTPYT